VPIYEYECQTCRKRVELIQKLGDPPPQACGACGATGSMRKLLAAPALQFKGSGWYITDYSNKGKAPAEGTAETKPASETGTKDAAANPAAPDKKPESSAGSTGSPSTPSADPK